MNESAKDNIGAKSILGDRLYSIVIIYTVAFIILGVMSFFNLISPLVPFAFIMGSLSSGLSSYFSVKITSAAKRCVVSHMIFDFVAASLALLNLSVWFLALRHVFYANIIQTDDQLTRITQTLLTFCVGASMAAMLARIRGDKKASGIATAAADRFETYICAITATIALAVAAGFGMAGAVVPMIIAAAGIICSLIGALFIRSESFRKVAEKNFAIIAGGLAAFALACAYAEQIRVKVLTAAAAAHGITYNAFRGFIGPDREAEILDGAFNLSITSPPVIIGLVVGCALPFALVLIMRRVKTRGFELSIMAVIMPIAVGLILGAEGVAGMLAGAVSVGFVMSLIFANAGSVKEAAGYSLCAFIKAICVASIIFSELALTYSFVGLFR